jgi:hypothetical protein
MNYPKFLTDTHHLLRMKKFDTYARLYTIVEAVTVIVVYCIFLSEKSQKCFQDLLNVTDNPLLLPIFLG